MFTLGRTKSERGLIELKIQLYNKYQNLDKSRSGNITNYFPILIANFEASARNKNGVKAAVGKFTNLVS